MEKLPKRLYPDDVAEILEVLPKEIQRFAGFVDYRPKMKVPKNEQYNRDYEGIARKLKEFTIRELSHDVGACLETTYKWARKARSIGLLKVAESGSPKIYTWIGDD